MSEIHTPYDAWTTQWHGSLTGTDEADSLYDGKGAEYFDGGSGQDTLVLGGKFADHRVSFDAATNTYWLGDADAAQGEGRELVNIEFLLFGDLHLDLADAVPRDGTQHISTAGDDQLVGSDLGYTLAGENGNDTLTGNGGDDTLYGGKGDDTAVFHGNRSDYTIVFDYNISMFVVADQRDDHDGRDTLAGIEHLRFADTTIAFDGIGSSLQPSADDLAKLDGVISAPPAPEIDDSGDFIEFVGIWIDDPIMLATTDTTIELIGAQDSSAGTCGWLSTD